MKRTLLTSAFILLTAALYAADVTTTRLYITTTPTTSSSLGMARNNAVDVRTWAEAGTATAVLIGANTGVSATNLYDHLASYPFSGISVAYIATNALQLTSIPGATFTLSASSGWCTIVSVTAPENKPVDVLGQTIRYREGSILSLDSTATIKDEGAGWTLTNPELKVLDTLSGVTSAAGKVNTAVLADRATAAVNATNLWGRITPTNLPPGLSTSNYVGTFSGDGTGITGITTSSTNAEYATTASWATNWAQADSKAAATNAVINNSLALASTTESWGIQLAVRGQASQTNDVFQIQNITTDLIFGIGPRGQMSWANALTNATGSTAAKLWLIVTNAGTAYVLPLHALSD